MDEAEFMASIFDRLQELSPLMTVHDDNRQCQVCQGGNGCII